MIPSMIADAAEDGGWNTVLHREALRGDEWTVLSRPGVCMVDVKRDRWRHTTARVYRGRALSAVLKGQASIAEYLRTP